MKLNEFNPLTYATVCSGIECMSAAVRGLPLKPVFFSEIEPYPCAVLRYRYPNVPNLGDMTQIKINNEKRTISNGTTTIPLPDGGLDILAGEPLVRISPLRDSAKARTPANCETGDDAISLCFNFIRLLRELQPRYFIYENVYGMLTSNEGRDFAHFLLALGQSGYGDVTWRVLDAQYVRVDGMERAVPQRRRRVWVVGCLGASEQRSAQILLEPGRMCGDSSPRRKTREELAASLGHGAAVHGQVVGVKSTNSKGGDVMPTLSLDLAKQTSAQQDLWWGYVISRKAIRGTNEMCNNGFDSDVNGGRCEYRNDIDRKGLQRPPASVHGNGGGH